ALLSQGPAPENPSPGLPEGKPLLARQCHKGLGPRLRGSPLPAVLMQRSRKVQGIRLALGMGQLLGARERLGTPLQGLVRIALKPQNSAHIGAASHPGIMGIDKSMGAVLLGIIERDALFEMCAASNELSMPEQDGPQGPVRLQEERRVLYTLR